MEVETTQAIDLRETKLREIIERGKASLTTGLEAIQQEFANRQDFDGETYRWSEITG